MEAADAAIEAANTNAPPAPDLSKVPEKARTPGGKMRPPGN